MCTATFFPGGPHHLRVWMCARAEKQDLRGAHGTHCMIGAILFHGLCEVYVRANKTEDVVQTIIKFTQVVSIIIYVSLMIYFWKRWNGWLTIIIGCVGSLDMLLTFTLPLPKSCAAYKLQTVEISKRFGDNAVVASLPKWQEILRSVRPRAEPAPTCTASTESAPRPEACAEPAPSCVVSTENALRPEALAPLTDPVSALTQARAEPAPTCTASTENALRPEALAEQPAPAAPLTPATSDVMSASALPKARAQRGDEEGRVMRPEALAEQPAPPTVVTSDSKERPQRSSTRTRKRPVGGPIQAA